jgi:hypothetical protein
MRIEVQNQPQAKWFSRSYLKKYSTQKRAGEWLQW